MREQGRAREARDLLAPVYGWFSEELETKNFKDARTLLKELGELTPHRTAGDALCCRGVVPG
jgi:hypothetical protein